ncbi:MAG: glycogen/starch synthase, partial [Chloroflexota bacterium]
MNILFMTAEAAPFAKVGGLGDVVAAGSLPTALRALGTDARVMLPLYGSIDRSKFNIKPLFGFDYNRRDGNYYVTVHTTTWHDVPFYFVEAYPFFGNEGSVYTDWNWDMPRYIFFNQVAMAASWEIQQQQDWRADVFHVNDWHTGLIPFFLTESRYKSEWSHIRSMLTIHNMAHQGAHAGGWLWELGVPGRDHPELRSSGLGDNLLGIGVTYADYVTTVSPRHAEEIQYPHLG